MSRDAPVEADPALVERIAARLAALRADIAERTDRSVRIVAVTKGHPVEVVRAVQAAGCGDLGESYAQELVAKRAVLDGPGSASSRSTGSNDPVWHFVGRLQSNKVRQLAGLVDLWQSVDRASLAAEIARRAPGAEVLVQLDLARLPGRGGCPPEQAADLVRACGELGLRVRGLMGVGIPGPPERSRPAFAELVALADRLDLPERSIGMSGDVGIAVDEGATIVRIGSALVGPRPAPGD